MVTSRSSVIFSDFIEETLDNKILSFLVHLSALFNKDLSIDKKNHQDFFDYIFYRIETDLREIGHGDMSVNKKMKIMLNKFYSILVDFKSFEKKTKTDQLIIINKYFEKHRNTDDFLNYLCSFFNKNIDLK